MPNEKTQPIQWTERPIALVAAGSFWPEMKSMGTCQQYLQHRLLVG